MKLLYVTPSYWPAFQYGGLIASNHNLNIALARKGINVTFYTTNVGLGKKVPLNQEVDIDGVKVTYFSFVKVFEFIGQTGWQFSLKMSKAIKDNINSFDLISLSAIYIIRRL